MALLVLGFLSILADHLWVGHRDDAPVAAGEDRRAADGVDPSDSKDRERMTPVTAQLLKATRTSRFGWLDEILERYRFSRKAADAHSAGE